MKCGRGSDAIIPMRQWYNERRDSGFGIRDSGLVFTNRPSPDSRLLTDMPGTLFVVATPIGNLEDITARALRVLGEVALIAAEDTRRTHHLLARYAIATPMTSLHEHNEGRKAPSLIEKLRHGESI